VGEGLAIMAFDKHRRQPALCASLLPTQRVPSALALLSVLVVAGQTQRAGSYISYPLVSTKM
jgi:hypothetical protein